MFQDSTKVVQTMDAVLDALGKRFGATGAHLWQVMIRQVYVNAIEAGVCLLVLVPLATYCVVRLRRSVADDKYHDVDMFWAIASIATVVLSIATVCFAADALSALANPEYGAIHLLLTAGKS